MYVLHLKPFFFALYHLDLSVFDQFNQGPLSSFLIELTGRVLKSNRVRIEDIVDSGTTLNELIPLLEAYKPRSIEVCALLHKRVAKIGVPPRWVGFDAPNEFLVGYGLDHAEDFRHLPYIASL